jgi:hypothetical protein
MHLIKNGYFIRFEPEGNGRRVMQNLPKWNGEQQNCHLLGRDYRIMQNGKRFPCIETLSSIYGGQWRHN